jgi:hypothetical protein
MAAVKNLCNCGIVIERGSIIFTGNIYDCIEKYANSFVSLPVLSKTKSEQLYNIDETKPFQVEKIEIIDRFGKQHLIYEAQEELRIRLYCLSITPILDMYGWLKLSTSDGKALIICDNREEGNNIFNNLSENKYTIDVIIPAGILSAGDYIISLCFGSGNYPDFYIQRLDDTLSFSITDSISLRGNARNALTSMITKWCFVREPL